MYRRKFIKWLIGIAVGLPLLGLKKRNKTFRKILIEDEFHLDIVADGDNKSIGKLDVDYVVDCDEKGNLRLQSKGYPWLNCDLGQIGKAVKKNKCNLKNIHE